MAGRLRILHVTDPHLHADPETELYGVKTDVSFRAILDDAVGAAADQYDAILATGDIVEDCSPEGYRRFRELMEPIPVPVLCVPGNHDDPGLMFDLFDGRNISCCASRDIGDWRFIMLNSHMDGEDGGMLADAELQRLERELDSSRHHNVMIGVHHQPVDMGSAWLDGYGLQNAAMFMATLARHENVRAVVWGHVHQASDRRHEGIRLISTPSTCAQFTPGTERCVMDVLPPGYRSIELSADGDITTTVHWLDDWDVDERPPDSRQT